MDLSIYLCYSRLPFLTKLRLSNIVVDSFGKEVFRHLLGGCEDIERLYLSFADTAYFFSGINMPDLPDRRVGLKFQQFHLQTF